MPRGTGKTSCFRVRRHNQTAGDGARIPEDTGFFQTAAALTSLMLLLHFQIKTEILYKLIRGCFIYTGKLKAHSVEGGTSTL